ncbi:type II toxin-antitoxin system RelE/ParE family toxin [Oceanobacillus alkalisoli]|uniref:type II toxin-antitoxin system RelE/ParE family toxin n=1 Tax=Oceanobacillus alkalisoli TaxID=2925113 RepID=UPI001F12283B|nr:type II toxin-antitoxin system RelE/ParE family toxin [Oceanobacillus alkalisoli]MCF3943013.1 type II toxin-antitoxin system RelE/ParE family toxin [Oceanobacillus alkalisoli]
MYDLKYLPLALGDIEYIINYISDHLQAPQAALDLLDTLDESIFRLKQLPYSCKVYQPVREMENEYRILLVKNYAVFYTVTEETVEIHRVVYAKMDLTKVIK